MPHGFFSPLLLTKAGTKQLEDTSQNILRGLLLGKIPTARPPFPLHIIRKIPLHPKVIILGVWGFDTALFKV
jgi:hypothetical protein